MAESRRAIVTGGTGFVGSRLCRALLADRWEVHVVAEPSAAMDQLGDAAPRIASVLRHDGTTESLVAWTAGVKPEVVFHLASLFVAEHQTSHVTALVQSNLLFGAQLAEAMSRCGATRLVNTGTSWQHFRGDGYDPVCLYAATKQAYEDLLEYWVSARGLRAVTLKLFDTYGPGDPRPKLFKLLGDLAARNGPLAMSAGEQVIDLVHVDDVVDAFLLAAERLLDGQVTGHERYAVSSEKPLKLRELVELYGRIAGISLPIRWGERLYREREVMVTWRTGRVLPGWRPAVELEAGIRGVIEGSGR